MATLNEDLNVVFPVITERVTRKEKGKDGKEKEVSEDVVRVWAYHTPISKVVFDANFRILAATKAALESKGGQYLASVGPRIAALTLRDEGLLDAESRGKTDENGNLRDDEVRALFAELKRLTMILCAGPNGWNMVPVDQAIAGGVMDAEDWEEVEASIVFFTCLSSMARKANRARIAQATAFHLKASITSLPASEYLNSLPRLTQDATSAPKAASSVPS
jgi:hypothetical protein